MGRTVKQAVLRGSRKRRQQFRLSCQTQRVNQVRWVPAATRCQGKLHIKTGVPCQDRAVAAANVAGLAAVAVLSDGAGSAKRSQVGAEAITNPAFITPLLSAFFDELAGPVPHNREALAKLLEILRNSISVAAQADCKDLQPASLANYASTFLAVAVKGNRYIAIHIGDGIIGMQVKGQYGQKLLALSTPVNGEYANETVFLTSGSAVENAQVHSGLIYAANRQVTGFILMSDGPEAALYDKRSKHPGKACAKLLHACRVLSSDELEAWLQSTLRNVIAQRTQDDCSLAILASTRKGNRYVSNRPEYRQENA